MNALRIEKICREEFSKINRLYHPDDEVNVYDFSPEIFMDYTAMCLHRNNRRKPTVQINFNVNPELPELGEIEYIKTHERMQKMGIASKVLMASERVFERMGMNGLYSKNISAYDFFSERGWTLKKRNDMLWYGVKMFEETSSMDSFKEYFFNRLHRTYQK